MMTIEVLATRKPCSWFVLGALLGTSGVVSSGEVVPPDADAHFESRVAEAPTPVESAAPDLSYLLNLLQSMPEGNWAQVNENRVQDVWAPPELQPLWYSGPTNPAAIIRAWSGFGWDPNRSALWIWGGGHANGSGNDVYRWDASSRLWTRASLPSEVVYDDVIRSYLAIDGPDRAPTSSHTYDNNEYLPIVDRFVTFGGATHSSGEPFMRRDEADPTTKRRTGPYVLNPNRASGDKVGGSTGSHVQREAPYPEILGSEMWQNRDSFKYYPGSSDVPVSFINGATDVVVEGGKDVVYAAAPGSQTEISLFRYVVNDVANPAADTWQRVGRFYGGGAGAGAGTVLSSLNLFVRTSGDRFVYWNLSTPGPTNNDVVFVPEDTSGQFVMDSYWGLDLDALRNRILMWKGGGTVFALEPPASVGPTGWVLRKQRTPTSVVPPTTVVTGVLGKWKYVKELDAFIGVEGEYDGNVWLYKPTGWVRPGGPDRDGDGMPNDWEVTYGFNPDSPYDASQDADGDGMTNLEEYKLGTNPRVADPAVPIVIPRVPGLTEVAHAGQKIVLEAEVVDRNDSYTAVSFYVNGEHVGWGLPTRRGTYRFDWTAPDPGWKDIQAKVWDPVDGDTISDPLRFSVKKAEHKAPRGTPPKSKAPR